MLGYSRERPRLLPLWPTTWSMAHTLSGSLRQGRLGRDTTRRRRRLVSSPLFFLLLLLGSRRKGALHGPAGPRPTRRGSTGCGRCRCGRLVSVGRWFLLSIGGWDNNRGYQGYHGSGCLQGLATRNTKATGRVSQRQANQESFHDENIKRVGENGIGGDAMDQWTNGAEQMLCDRMMVPFKECIL